MDLMGHPFVQKYDAGSKKTISLSSDVFSNNLSSQGSID